VEDLPRELLADRLGEVRRPVAAVEGADVGVGLLEAGMLAGGDRQVADDVERMSAAGRPTIDDRDDDLGHGADQALDLEDVQPSSVSLRPGLVDRVGRLAGGVLVAGTSADPLVATGAERPLAVRGGRAVAGDEDDADIGGHPRVVEGPVELVHRVWPEGVEHLGPVERHADHSGLGVRATLPGLAAVVGDVGEVHASDDVPLGRIEDLRHLRSGLAGPAGSVVGRAVCRLSAHGTRH
jgi:hypothetical protein